jgi:peptidoglycan/LPS O-acetylase OafA/YrhL
MRDTNLGSTDVSLKPEVSKTETSTLDPAPRPRRPPGGSLPPESDTTRLLPSGDEAGTAPGDRKFRPDVEGLRAVAILLVVLYHAGVPRITGGFIGVDVFFVISGFVITGLLLRERIGTDSTSLAAFYGRRVRRILPAATVVLIVTVAASYHYLGFLRGNSIADDARTAGLFVSNFHFASLGTNYLSAQQPPSPLQNFWSLSVEEQFYVFYPSLFLVLAALARRWSLRAKLTGALAAVIVGSFVWSVIGTASNPTATYFSPFARAWELALGGLVAVGTTQLGRIPVAVARLMSWAGLGAIVLAAFLFNAGTPYPGSAVSLPVVGTALILMGGAAQPQWGAESLLGLRPFQMLGALSFSLYLWHWPILTIASQEAGKTLSVGQNLLWVLVALVLSVVSYFVIENPIRHAAVLVRHKLTSLALGAVLIAATLIFATLQISGHP